MLLRGNMKARRAIGFAVLAYILTMIVGMITTTVAGLDITTISTPPLWLCIVSSIAASLLCLLAAWVYFRGKHTKRGAIYGLYFAIYMVIVGFIMDILMWTLAMPGGATMEGIQQLLQYYTQWYFWLTFVLIFVASILTGKYMKKH